MRADAGSSVKTAKRELTDVALGTHASGETVFAFHEVPDVAQRGLASRFTLTPSGTSKYAVEVRSSPEGPRWLAAADVTGAYEITVPVYVEGDSAGSLWVGIRNEGAEEQAFTLTALRVEKLA